MRTVNHIVLYSGGLDSFTLLNWVMRYKANPYQTKEEVSETQHKLQVLSFIHDNRARGKKPTCVADVCNELSIPFIIRQLDVAKPGRITAMLGLAFTHALAIDPDAESFIYYGANVDEHGDPECSPDYNDTMAEAFSFGSEGRVCLMAPFMMISRIDILADGLLRMGIPLASYANTWSCSMDEAKPCGECEDCRDRRTAFRENNVNDPLTP